MKLSNTFKKRINRFQDAFASLVMLLILISIFPFSGVMFPPIVYIVLLYCASAGSVLFIPSVFKITEDEK